MSHLVLSPACVPLSPQGAFWGLLFGLAVGLVRLILEFVYQSPACGEVDGRPALLRNFHYLYFALLLCGLTAAVIIVVSLCTTPIPEEKASDLWGLNFTATHVLLTLWFSSFEFSMGCSVVIQVWYKSPSAL